MYTYVRLIIFNVYCESIGSIVPFKGENLENKENIVKIYLRLACKGHHIDICATIQENVIGCHRSP